MQEQLEELAGASARPDLSAAALRGGPAVPIRASPTPAVDDDELLLDLGKKKKKKKKEAVADEVRMVVC